MYLGFWQYWLALVPRIPGLVFGAAKTARSVVFTMIFLALAFNRPLGRVMGAAWEGIAPSWSLVFILGLFIYGLMRAIHDEYRMLHEFLSTSRQENENLKQQIGGPPISSHEQEQQRIVSEKMAKFTLEEAKVIEAPLRHGEIHRKDIKILGFSVELLPRYR